MGRLARGNRRCVVAGCERDVKPGRPVCAAHWRTREGKAARAALRGLASAGAAGTGETAEPVTMEELTERLARRLERGDGAALLDGRLREVVERASRVQELRQELGAGRLVMMRLLSDEEDLGELALGMSRIISANARVERARHAMGVEDQSGLTRAIDEFLARLEGE